MAKHGQLKHTSRPWIFTASNVAAAIRSSYNYIRPGLRHAQRKKAHPWNRDLELAVGMLVDSPATCHFALEEPTPHNSDAAAPTKHYNSLFYSTAAHPDLVWRDPLLEEPGDTLLHGRGLRSVEVRCPAR